MSRAICLAAKGPRHDHHHIGDLVPREEADTLDVMGDILVVLVFLIRQR